MVRKKMEGDETQRRVSARRARAAGSSPSAENLTTGALKRPRTRPGQEPHRHAGRLEDIRRGEHPGHGVPGAKRYQDERG